MIHCYHSQVFALCHIFQGSVISLCCDLAFHTGDEIWIHGRTQVSSAFRADHVLNQPCTVTFLRNTITRFVQNKLVPHKIMLQASKTRKVW